MVFRRRTYRKKFTPRRFRRTSKKVFRKKFNAVARRVNIGRDVHYFKRGSSAYADLVGNAAYGPGVGYINALTFSLDQVRQPLEFTSLFDRYKITHVQLKFFMRLDPGAQPAGSAYTPRMWWIHDYDDSAPTVIDSMREHCKVKTALLKPGRPIVINVKPATLALIYNGATSAYSPQWSKWLDCGYSNIPNYGLKYALDQFDNPNYRIAIEATYWLAFKDTR